MLSATISCLAQVCPIRLWWGRACLEAGNQRGRPGSSDLPYASRSKGVDWGALRCGRRRRSSGHSRHRFVRASRRTLAEFHNLSKRVNAWLARNRGTPDRNAAARPYIARTIFRF